MGKVICVGNQKGGVGKTTTCVNLGTALAQAGEKVCLTVIQWVCTAAASVVSVIFALIGGVFIIIGILSYLMGHEPLLVMWRMIGTGAGLCLLPIIGEWIAVQVSYLNLLAKAWLLS